LRRYAGLGEFAEGDYDSWLVSNSLAVLYDFALANGWTLTPKAGLDVAYLNREAFAEHGAANAVSYSEYDELFWESVLGLRVAKAFAADGVSISPHAGLGWRHDLGGNDMTVRQRLATTAAEVTQENDDDFLTTEVGLVFSRDAFNIELAYSGEVSDHSDAHSLVAAFRLAF
jgi:outer membrane autotransporter protein